jgi:hypothetical protein
VVVGVDVPVDGAVVAGVALSGAKAAAPGASAAGLASAEDASRMSFCAVPPRRGERSSRVVVECRLSDDTVSEGDRCRPARRSRTSEGRFVDADRKSRTSTMEFDGRTFRGIAVAMRSQLMFQGVS